MYKAYVAKTNQMHVIKSIFFDPQGKPISVTVFSQDQNLGVIQKGKFTLLRQTTWKDSEGHELLEDDKCIDKYGRRYCIKWSEPSQSFWYSDEKGEMGKLKREIAEIFTKVGNLNIKHSKEGD